MSKKGKTDASSDEDELTDAEFAMFTQAAAKIEKLLRRNTPHPSAALATLALAAAQMTKLRVANNEGSEEEIATEHIATYQALLSGMRIVKVVKLGSRGTA
jgi:hypothetical protein